MSDLSEELSASELATIAFETGITGGALNSLSGQDWDTTTTYAALYNAASGSAHKWGDSELGSSGGVVTYTFDPGSGFTAAQEAVYVAALTLWSDETNITFQLATDPAQAQVTFSLSGTASPGVPTDGGAFESSYFLPGTAGSTTIPTIVSADLFIDTAGFGDLSSFTSQGGYSISTVVHEIGHLLGLAHGGPYNGDVDSKLQQYNATDSRLWTIMSYIAPNDTDAKYFSDYTIQNAAWGVGTSSTTPQMLDILAAQELYGTPTSTAYSGGQIFGFNTNITDASRIFFDFTINTNPVVTIWDSGTGNTLDLSGFYLPSFVNLNAGSFSNVDGMTDNIGIAYGTTIDTAIGGYGDDTFVVNGGDDRIEGGAGTNTVIFADSYASYRVHLDSAGTITVSQGTITNTLTDIQVLVFADQTISVSGLIQNQDTFTWAGGTGNFATAGNWIDSATGQTATTAPGAQDVAVIAGPSSGGPETIEGTGAVQQLVFTGLNGVVGSLSTGALTIGHGDERGDSLTIAPGATISAASAALVNGTLLDQGQLRVTGALTLAGDELDSTLLLQLQNGGLLRASSLVLEGASVAIDATSGLLVGSGSSYFPGSTIVGEDGTITGYGTFGASVGGLNNAILDLGTITAVDGVLSLPAVEGSGLVQIASNGTLRLLSVVAGSPSPTISFVGVGGTLSVGTAIVEQFGTIANFAAGDEIALTGLAAGLLQPVYTKTGDDLGTLEVSNAAGNLVFSATLTGDYSNSVFMLLPAGSGSYEIVTAQGSLTGSTTPSVGTAGSTFAWMSGTSGDWNTAGNWAMSATNSQTVATVAPGARDSVVIGSPGQMMTLVISGNGQANSLSLFGSDAFSGTVEATALHVGAIGDGATLALIGSGAVEAQTATIIDSTVDVASGTSFTVSGNLSIALSSSSSPTAATLAAYGGGRVQVGSLTLASTGTPITIDSLSSMEVGSGGTVTAGALTVDAGATVSGYGMMSSVNVLNSGTVTASGGTLALGYAQGSGVYDIDTKATLSVGHVPTAGLPTFDFIGTSATLYFNLVGTEEIASFGTVVGFASGETMQFAATLALLPTIVTYTSTGADGGTLVLSNVLKQQIVLSLVGHYDQSEFSLLQTSVGVTSLTVACFASGTRIATEGGWVAVERLRLGDRVLTAEGGSQPVTWLGYREVACGRHAQPQSVQPVRIRQDAFGIGLPERDLLLSPDHAIYAEGVLIPVKYLIDGERVVQEARERITYWHVELPQHDVILAEGLPAESYLDTGDRASFANGGDAVALHPAWGSEARDIGLVMEAMGYAPLRVTGPEVKAVRARLAEANLLPWRDRTGRAG